MNCNFKFLSFVIFVALFCPRAHAGFQFGDLCQDAKGALYLFKEDIQQENAEETKYTEKTECLRGLCNPKLLKIKGILADKGLVFASDEITVVNFDHKNFDAIYGKSSEVAGLKVRGIELICTGRRHLDEICNDTKLDSGVNTGSCHAD